MSGGIPQEIKAVWEPDLLPKINECIWNIDALERDLKVSSFSLFLFPGGLGHRAVHHQSDGHCRPINGH